MARDVIIRPSDGIVRISNTSGLTSATNDGSLEYYSSGPNGAGLYFTIGSNRKKNIIYC